jgi:hypothetical protein
VEACVFAVSKEVKNFPPEEGCPVGRGGSEGRGDSISFICKILSIAPVKLYRTFKHRINHPVSWRCHPSSGGEFYSVSKNGRTIIKLCANPSASGGDFYEV